MRKKVILVIGACGSIGQELSLKIAKKYQIILVDKNHKKLIQLKKFFIGIDVMTFAGDVTKGKIIDRLLSLSIKKYSKIDAVVFCAYPKSPKFGVKFENLEENSLREDLYSQLGSLIIFCQKIAKFFLKFKSGNIIFISSIQGVAAPKFDHYTNLKMTSPIEYSVIKAGIISMTKYLSKYFRKKNINVNCVSPGGIKDGQDAKFISRYNKSCNSKGLLLPNDIVGSIEFLLSDESKYINGHNIVVDDGWCL